MAVKIVDADVKAANEAFDSMGPCIIMDGNFGMGFQFCGPFSKHSEAQKYASDNYLEEYTIQFLMAP